MKIIYSDEALPLPSEANNSIFLVGPTARSPLVQGWRPRALDILEHIGYNGIVFYPEPHILGNWPRFNDQIEWEHTALEMATAIACWVPREMENMPGLTTNIEFGIWVQFDKLFLGCPDDAEHVDYMKYVYNKWTGRQSSTTMLNLLHETTEWIRKG